MYLTNVNVLDKDLISFNYIKYNSLYVAEELQKIFKIYYDLNIRVEGYTTELKDTNIYKIKYPFYSKLEKSNNNLKVVLDSIAGHILTNVYKEIEVIFIDINIKERDNIEIVFKE